jgi:hypothetical protein
MHDADDEIWECCDQYERREETLELRVAHVSFAIFRDDTVLPHIFFVPDMPIAF